MARIGSFTVNYSEGMSLPRFAFGNVTEDGEPRFAKFEWDGYRYDKATIDDDGFVFGPIGIRYRRAP